MGKFRVFVIFGVNLKHFHLKKTNKLSGKAYWTIHSFNVDPSQRSNPQSLSKMEKNTKNFQKWENFRVFCQSR